GVFTTNDFPAAPVILSKERIGRGYTRAVIVNSGNANAATGPEGYKDAVMMAAVAAQALGVEEGEVLAASTGVIGHRLPIAKIAAAVPDLVKALRADGIAAAEEAIMTTDRFPKIAHRRTVLEGREITVGGIAKGAGMIEPTMATMLAFIMTDAAVEREALLAAFRYGVARSFNAISVDGCMSTNDTALIMASGAAGNRPIRKGGAAYPAFRDTLTEVLVELARAMVRDGEGATKVIEICIEGADTLRNAKRVAKAVANANLVKAAFFGGDPNWGRIISAAGSLGIGIPMDRAELYFEDVPLFKEGRGVAADRARLERIMAADEIRVTLKLAMGKASWKVWSSDLTYDYVRINAHYTT
ncbi:MAG: bifunctional glutamate N-acetyltransferase/amino-acid acetyltransferase ArgJ, partial [Syntrophales bacterium]|nr:bifunctional glutamate N-acetyltransferase/amino-acid acetyltransferase ArgJ [Syntrophales bacterium]